MTADDAPATRDSQSFYRDGGAGAIMRAAHFPDELLSFLQMEGLAVLDAASRNGCDSLVELGCYDGRSLEVARAAGIGYLGVDVSHGAVAALERRIADEGLTGRAAGVVGDILCPDGWRSAVPGRRPLQLLPFNLAGNLAEPEKAVAGLREVGELAVISVFNDEPWTTEVRRAYYTACGITVLEEVRGAYGGVLFRGVGGFRSQSFGTEGMAALLDAAGASAVGTRTNRLGRCVTVRFG
ncbi:MULTISPECIES: hypothetical protein [Streptomycetaceae]|uniref:Methyltransferase domain-containing protein n=1 Tax=Streptantibioticus cattleyicolor (strain ATCC 35852 / DSM 46488 / JCM 4925 / NBRC 14057 / NRRL 8057) TaxID=1003195 RepID=F8JUK4_STREN|nr:MULTISPECIES: hypothetical protein [Streptomycetaceae]AEW95631.1 hypothetical protein SCATT_32600 [Streptantibioticus cattleyicolor NRRL 8057 = DSM 46488]MYS60176.1 hypothetical protein [Streptomyces sp. SID5468]CCB75966.1 conserved protein of unknown function [Streptantibioticus cattleyicolor NRRL 8057 = DSM 46488]